MTPSRTKWPVAIAVITAVLAACAVPATADIRVSYASGGSTAGMNVVDDPGGATNITLTRTDDASAIGVRSFVATQAVTAGSGCTRVAVNEVRCTVTGPRVVTVSLGDGNDRITSFNESFGARPIVGTFVRGGDGNDDVQMGGSDDAVDGEGGDDELAGTGGNDTVNGGPGNDVLGNAISEHGNDTWNGGDGNDRLNGRRDVGNDVYRGGGGVDLLTFSDEAARVLVSLNDLADDGPAGETDNAASDIENLQGTNFDDVLVGDSDRNLIEGFAGNDVLRGGTPPAFRTSMTLLFVGDDVLDGGTGGDLVQGEGGDDRLLVRDAINDQSNAAISCGGGNDRLDADLADDDTRVLPADCETLDQGAITEGENVVLPSRAFRVRRGAIRPRLRCPARVEIGCRGRLAVGPARRAGLRGAARRKRYAIATGRSRRVRVAVPRRLRRSVRRGRRVFARLLSVETGVHGPKTTFTLVRLRR